MGKRVALSITIGVAVVLIGGACWAFATGWLRIGDGNMTTTTARVVCGDDKVATYNDARRLVFQDDSAAEPTWDQAALDQLANDIKKTDGYETDATCQTILFWTAYYHEDLQGVQTAYDGIKSLHAQHVFANSNLSDITSLEQYESMVQELSTPRDEGVGTN